MKKALPLLFFLPCLAFGDLVWPALYVEVKMLSIPVILGSLIFEFFVIWALFRKSARVSALMALAANAVSAALGYLLIPLSGVVWELLVATWVMPIFDWGTFNPLTWFFVPVLGGLINAVVELGILRLIWKTPFSKKNFAVFWAMNWVTIGAATICALVSPPQL